MSVIENHKNKICCAGAVLAGLFVGWVDIHNDEPQAAVLVLLVLCGCLGLASPGRAWLWALIAGPGIFFTYAVAPLIGLKALSPPQPNDFACLLALIPAFIGAYAGAALRWCARIGRQS